VKSCERCGGKGWVFVTPQGDYSPRIEEFIMALKRGECWTCNGTGVVEAL